MRLRPTAAIAALTTVLLIVAACSAGDETPSPGAESDAPPTGIESLAPPPLVRGPTSNDGIQAILATSDLGVGTHRFGFLLTSDKGFILAPEAQVSLRFDGADASADHEAVAENHVWPLGIRGLFTTDLTFDKPGPWSVDIAFEDADGSIKRAALAFDVPQQPNAPSPGDPAIASATRTLGDGGSVASLTTGSFQDPGFYRIPLAQAITNGRPTVFVVASPAFCTNATCGPILETLHEVQGEYQDRVNFVHADFFDNPGDIQDDLSNARVSPVAEEWGVSNAEWTFVIDGRGVVSHKFEGYVTFDELDAALSGVL